MESRAGHARPRRHGAGPRRRPRRAGADAAPAGLRHHRRGRHGPRGRRALPGQRGRLRRGRRAGERRRRAGGREDRRRAACRGRRSSATWSTTIGPRPASCSTARGWSPRSAAGAQAGQTIVFTNGCFDLLHVGHVRLLRAGRGPGRLPRRRAQLRRERPPAQGAEPAAQSAKTPAPSCWRPWSASTP